MKRLKIRRMNGRLAGYLEQDTGQEAWHWVGTRRSRRFAALGHAFGSVWSSISEFRNAVREPICIDFGG